MEAEIEDALDPGRFISDRGCFRFVDGLGQVATAIGRLVADDPERAATLYETFLAGCYEKAEEVDDSSGSFGMFAQSLISGWIAARQAAQASPQQTTARPAGLDGRRPVRLLPPAGTPSTTGEPRWASARANSPAGRAPPRPSSRGWKAARSLPPCHCCTASQAHSKEN